MFAVKAPLERNTNDPKSTRRAPRQKKKVDYIYKAQNTTDIRDVVISIINGIGIQAVDPALFPRLIQPLFAEQQTLIHDRNDSALKEVNLAIDFIQRVQAISQKQSCNSQVNVQEIIYSNFALNKFANAAMNGQAIPVLPPKLKLMLVDHLEEIANKTENQEELQKAEDAIFKLTNTKKLIRTTKSEELLIHNKPETNETDESVDKIMRKLARDIEKIDRERDLELERLKISRDAQMKIIERQGFRGIMIEDEKQSDDIISLKQQEQYYMSIRKPKKVEEIRRRIKSLSDIYQVEMQNRWENELENQRKAIITTFEEKYNIKVKFFKHKTLQLKRNAEKEIARIRQLQATPKLKPKPCKALPSLRPKRRN